MARILIVEDESLVALDIKRCLEDSGHFVCGTAISGEDGINLARKEKPHLALMDIKLQGEMNGISAAAQISHYCRIPVIFLTAHGDERTINEARAIGPKAFLVKPFKDIDLKAAVSIALGTGSQNLDPVFAVPPSMSHFGTDLPQDASPPPAETPRSLQAKAMLPSAKSIWSYLSSLPFFSQLTTTELEELANSAAARAYKQGEAIIKEGDTQVLPFLVYQGRVEVVGSSEIDKELVLTLITSEDILGLLPAVNNRSSTFSTRASRPSIILTFPPALMRLTFERHCELYRRLTHYLSEHLRAAFIFARAMAHDDASSRLNAALLSLVRRFSYRDGTGDSLFVQASRQELARFTGLSLETVVRLLRKLGDEGIVRLDRRRTIEIVDSARLYNLVSNAEKQSLN